MVYGAYAYTDLSTVQDIAAGLAALPPARLQEVARARGVEIGSLRWQGRTDAALTLAARIGSAPAIGGALDALSARELATLRAIWRLGPTLARDRLPRILAAVMDEAELARTLDRLETLALVLPADDDRSVFVPAAVRGVLAGNESTPRPAAALFRNTGGATLGAIALQLGVDELPRRKDDRLGYIVHLLQQTDVVRRQLNDLSDVERQIFEFVVRRGGMAEPYRILQKFPSAASQHRAYGYNFGTEYFLHGDGRGDQSPLLRLQLRGLLAPYPSGYPSYLAIPDEVLTARLPTFQLDPADFIEPPFAPPPPEAQPAGLVTTPLLDLLDALRYAEESDLALTKSYRLPKPPRTRLTRLLGAADPAYADFLLAAAIAGELLRPNPHGKLAPRKKALETLLDRDDRDARAWLLHGWLALNNWYDPGDEPYLRGDSAGAVGTPRADRESALRLLLASPAEGATLASLADRLRYHQPRHFAEEDTPLGPYVFGERPSAAALLLGVLRVLGWLGLAEPLALPARPGEPGATVALRLTSLGRDVIAGELDAPRPAPVEPLPRTDRIVVQPTLDILAPPNIAPRVYRDLRRFADLAGTGGMRTLTLSAASLRRGLDAGVTPESIRAFLERHAGGLPSTIVSLIDEAAGRYGRVRVGNAAVYITVDDPPLLTELAADRRLADLGLAQIAPTVAVVPSGSAEIVIGRLRAVGQMPVADEPRPLADPLQQERATAPAKRPGAKKDEPVDPTVQATLAQAQKRDEMVDVTYHRRGNSGPQYAKHRLTVLDFPDEDQVYGRCWLCNTSVRLSIARITEATLTGEENPEIW